MDTNQPLTIIAICVVVFFVARELFCWYWKINEVVSLLTSIDNKLDQQQLSAHTTKSRERNDACCTEPSADSTIANDGYWNSDGKWVQNG
jgi:hypothetical protein